MPSTPSTFSPVTLSRTWLDVFETLDQWEDVNKFYTHQARELNTVQGHRRLCSPKVGHLVALRAGGVQLVHHIHQEDVDDFHGTKKESSGHSQELEGQRRCWSLGLVALTTD